MTAITAEGINGKLDIGQAFGHGWRLFVKDIGPLLVGALIAIGLSIVTLGILAGPLMAGLYGMVIGRVRDGRQAQVGDVFGGMNRFWSYFAAALVLGLLIGLAWVTVIGGVLLSTIWLYVFPFMVDKDMGLGDAMKASYELVKRAGFWEHLALVVIGVVIASVGNGLLAILVAPFLVALTVAAYIAVDGGTEQLDKV